MTDLSVCLSVSQRVSQGRAAIIIKAPKSAPEYPRCCINLFEYTGRSPAHVLLN